MAYLVLVRHGQSEWNALNKFTGQTDVPLTEKGREEARAMASLIRDIEFDKAYTSGLSRATETLNIILETLGRGVPTTAHKAITERDYGDLVGLNKEEIRKKYGEEAFKAFRRGWDVRPPGGESLKDTSDRTIPYFKKHILADLQEGKNVLVSAHGNSLRAIIKHVKNISDDDVAEVEMDWGVAHVYEFDRAGMLQSASVRI